MRAGWQDCARQQREEEEEIQYTKDDPEKMYTDASTAPSSDEDNKA